MSGNTITWEVVLRLGELNIRVREKLNIRWTRRRGRAKYAAKEHTQMTKRQKPADGDVILTA